MGTQAELSSLKKGGKTLTAEDSVRVVAEAHAGESVNDSGRDHECKKCKSFVDLLRTLVEEGDELVKSESLAMCHALASEAICSSFEDKIKDLSSVDFKEMIRIAGSLELCMDVGLCMDEGSATESSLRFKSTSSMKSSSCSKQKCPHDGSHMVDNDSW